MNYSSAVMLINDQIRAVKIIYEDDKEKPSQQRYIFKTLDHAIKVDDLVVIPTETRQKATVVRVVEVDVDVDYDSDVQLKWIIDRVNLAPSQTIIAEELKWIEELKKSEKLAKRKEIKDKMFAMYKNEDMQKLAITNLKDVPFAAASRAQEILVSKAE